MGHYMRNCAKIGIICVIAVFLAATAMVSAVPSYNGTKNFFLNGNSFVQSTPSTFWDGPNVQIGTAVETPDKGHSQAGTLEVSNPGIRGSSSSNSTANSTSSGLSPQKMIGLQVSTFEGPAGTKNLGATEPKSTSFVDNPATLPSLFSKSQAFKAAAPNLPKTNGISEKTTAFGKTVAASTGIKSQQQLKANLPG
jgi:hypothetical protein